MKYSLLYQVHDVYVIYLGSPLIKYSLLYQVCDVYFIYLGSPLIQSVVPSVWCFFHLLGVPFNKVQSVVPSACLFHLCLNLFAIKWTGPPKSFLFSRSISKQNRKHTDNIHSGFLNKIISIPVGYLNVLIKKFGFFFFFFFFLNMYSDSKFAKKTIFTAHIIKQPKLIMQVNSTRSTCTLSWQQLSSIQALWPQSLIQTAHTLQKAVILSTSNTVSVSY